MYSLPCVYFSDSPPSNGTDTQAGLCAIQKTTSFHLTLESGSHHAKHSLCATACFLRLKCNSQYFPTCLVQKAPCAPVSLEAFHMCGKHQKGRLKPGSGSQNKQSGVCRQGPRERIIVNRQHPRQGGQDWRKDRCAFFPQNHGCPATCRMRQMLTSICSMCLVYESH